MKVGLFDSTQSGFQWVADRVWKVEHAFERANATGEKARSTRMRIFIILCCLGTVYCLLMLFAARASLFHGAGQIAALTGQTHARGQLVDRNGALLATDVDNFDLFVDPTDMTAEDRVYVRRALAQLFPNLPRETLDKAFRRDGRALLTGNLDAVDRAKLLEYGLPGVSFEAQRVRRYPLGTTGAFYIGMTKRAGEGMSGAEKSLEEQIVASANGQAVPLAMDLRVQGALENELRAMAVAQKAVGAVGLVINVRTGEVLGMASWPEFDLNRPGDYPEAYKRNHAAVDRYELGSIFKAISVGIGLDTGTASMNSVYDARQPLVVGGRKIHDLHATNAYMGLEDVFIKSSNIGTGFVALNAGKDNFTRYYEAIGLFRSADIELTEPASPLYPKTWTDLSLVQTAFGQGIAITPLSFAEAIMPLLNGGYRRPLTIKKHDGSTPLAGDRVFSAATSRTMLDLMRANVTKGSGARANAPGLRVGGKTGTAQKPGRGGYTSENIASFAAVFPTDGPVDGDRYLVLTIYDSPQGAPESSGSRMGGLVAAPVAGRVIDRIAPFVGVARREDKFATPQWDKAPIQAVEEEH